MSRSRPARFSAAAWLVRTAMPIALVPYLGAPPAAAQFFQFPFGQQQQQQPPQRQRPAPPAARPKLLPQPEPTPSAAPTPYDPDLQRLSEILGALHFLRGICGANEGQKWRNEALALIDAEAPGGPRHDQMVQAFNRGYAGFQQSYRTCTPAATVAIHRYLQEGAQISRDITAHYAN
ncbi:MAG TPA: TIGR02301 family protein [Xanthobacteraceae bacterium]|nr:TIGR02301 family protein [Xanthobacteraceae bacterium]